MIIEWIKNNKTGMGTTCGTPTSRPSLAGSIDFDEETGEIDAVHIKPICNQTTTESPN